MVNWKVRPAKSKYHAIIIDVDMMTNKDWEQWVLLSSDRHLDNPKSDELMQREHLREAKDKGAIVLDFGDLFCAMQGKYDPRSNKKDVKEEHNVDDYLDALVNSHIKFFSNYKENLAVFGYGNHETAILDRLETDLTKRLVKGLRKEGSFAQLGGYCGWVRLMFNDERCTRDAKNIYYTHGSGGNSPVTKGVIRTARRGIYLPDADFICAGHIHEAWNMAITRVRLSNKGEQYADEQMHIQIPTYKEEFFGSNKGFHHKKEGPPKPLGAWWIRFYFNRKENRIKSDIIRAK